MIEKLLLRIANRGPKLSGLQSDDITVLPYGADSKSSNPFAASQADSASQAPRDDALVAWELALDAHYSGGETARAEESPPAFASFSPLHAQIGSLIWQEQSRIRKNLVHVIASGGDVIAEINPSERTVAVRKNLNLSKLHLLSLKELPLSAKPLSSGVAASFDVTTVHMLLWYYGQTVPEAVQILPAALLKSKMLLRKLPLVPPNALHVRQLHLISLFSSGAIYLPRLLSQLSEAAAPSICADLASLHLTGCLVSHDGSADPL